jgi:copper chaperone NosL
MRSAAVAGLLIAIFVLAGCNDKKAAELSPPHELTASAIGNYCGMNVLEHPGPKGQVILASRLEPVWFSSARDAFAFTMLPEEPKDIRAIYVSDMAKAPSWEEPGATNWVDAKQAFYVVGSRVKGGMGAPETVPFSDRSAAEKFASENGGRVLTFSEVPRDYVLGSGTATTSSVEHGSTPGEGHGRASGVPKRRHAH